MPYHSNWPNSAEDDASIGDIVWSNPEGAIGPSDGVYASTVPSNENLVTYFYQLKLVVNDVIVGDNKSPDIGNLGLTTNVQYYPFGGSSDTWGVSLTRDDIISSGFGVALSFSTLNAGVATHYLKVTDFGFGFNPGEEYVTIDGIVVYFLAKYNHIDGSGYFTEVDEVYLEVHYTVVEPPTPDLRGRLVLRRRIWKSSSNSFSPIGYHRLGQSYSRTKLRQRYPDKRYSFSIGKAFLAEIQLEDISSELAFNLEYIANIAANNKFNAEFVGQTTKEIRHNIEFLLLLSRLLTTNNDFCVNISRDNAVNVEFLSKVDKGLGINFEGLGEISGSRGVNLEYLMRLSNEANLNLETLLGASKLLTPNVELLKVTGSNLTPNLEYIREAASTLITNVEYLSGLISTNGIPVEYLSRLIGENALNIETLLYFADGTTVPMEYLLTVGANQTLNVEYSTIVEPDSLSATLPIPFEFLTNQTKALAANHEYLIALQASRAVNIESLLNALLFFSFEHEYLARLGAESLVGIEYKFELGKSLSVNLENLIQFSGKDLIINNEFLSDVGLDIGAAIEYLASVNLGLDLPVSFGSNVSIDGVLNFEYLASVGISQEILVELLKEASQQLGLNIEYSLSNEISVDLVIPIEYLVTPSSLHKLLKWVAKNRATLWVALERETNTWVAINRPTNWRGKERETNTWVAINRPTNWRGKKTGE